MYTVTFCIFDQSTGANMLWHGGFFLSKLNGQQMEVVETWGYYGMPLLQSRASGSLKEKFMALIGLPIDFEDNHGWLMHEEYRFMCLGQGLYGDTFEISEKQFKILQEECKTRVNAQEEAVRNALAKLPPAEDNKPTKKTARYPGEERSREIFKKEKERADRENDVPHLHPFNLSFSLTWNGFSMMESRTCKAEALDILSKVLSPEQLAPYRLYTFPRWVSNGMEKILLHHEGPLDMHTKASGEVVYFPNESKPGVKLVWTVPPQKFSQLSDNGAKALLAIDNEYLDKIKDLASKLQRTEILLQNAVVAQQYDADKCKLIAKVRSAYKLFSLIEPKIKTEKVSGWRGYAFTLFDIPKNFEQEQLAKKLFKGQKLLRSIATAIGEQWSIDDKLEAVVSHMSQSVQEELNKVIASPISATPLSEFSC